MKKRVLHLLSSNSFSGAENVAINIIKSLEEEYEFIYVSPKGPIEEVLKEKKVEFIALDNINPYTLNKLLKKWKPDIIHAHDFRASIKSVFSLYKCKKISHIHQNPSWIKSINIYSIAYMSTCFVYNNILTVSSQIKDEAIFCKLLKNKITILNNYVNREEVIQKSKIVCKDKEYDVVYVGRLVEEKDPIRFINIIKEVAKEKQSIKVAIVGDGILRSECEQLVNSLKLDTNIEIMGFLNNPYSIINKAKVLVMTSKWEGFGLVAVEAMILGKPVIATPVGGLKNIIDNKCGVLFDNDEDAVNSILKMLSTHKYYDYSKNAKDNSLNFTDGYIWKLKLKNIYK